VLVHKFPAVYSVLGGHWSEGLFPSFSPSLLELFMSHLALGEGWAVNVSGWLGGEWEQRHPHLGLASWIKDKSILM